MKKVIFLFVMIFLLCGCDGKYEMELYNDKVIEKSTAWYPKSEVTGDVYEYTKEFSLKYDDNGDFLSYDRKKNLHSNGKVGLELTNIYQNMEEFQTRSNVFGICYLASNATSYDKDYITIKTSNEFTCMDTLEELESVTIAIKSNHKLKETNADKVKGHTYYWYITKENYHNKPISLVLYENKYVWNYNNEILKRLGLIIFGFGGTVLVVLGIYKTYKRKDEQVNF